MHLLFCGLRTGFYPICEDKKRGADTENRMLEKKLVAYSLTRLKAIGVGVAGWEEKTMELQE